MTDIAVIGAGIAGLVCVQQLSQAAYSVLVVEMSSAYPGFSVIKKIYNFGCVVSELLAQIAKLFN